MMKFFTKFGGVETTTPWNRPTKEKVIEWKQSLTCTLDDWYIVGNFVEGHSPTWDLDILLIQRPLKLSLNDLSKTFTEMITKGFEHELLIDCAWMPEFYQDIWREIIKIRPDDRFYKELNGGIYNPVYTADKVTKIHPQLWQYEYDKPHDNWFKGKNRNYNFTGIPLSTYGDPKPKYTLDQQIYIDYCKDGSTIIDVGGQSGEFVHYANDTMSNGKIYSLEPDTNYLSKLEIIDEKNDNQITIIPTAAGSWKGVSKLYNQGTGCMVDVKDKIGNYIECNVDTLDNLFPYKVDLIKIDVEAYEYEVILGAKTHLERGTPFLVEIHNKWLREIGKSKEDIIELFEKKGYNSQFLYRPHHQMKWADIYYYMFTK